MRIYVKTGWNLHSRAELGEVVYQFLYPCLLAIQLMLAVTVVMSFVARWSAAE
jgi:hypothetical protein